MLVVAHRGYSAKFPENTLEAFKQGIQVGAQGIELDIHLSKDDKLVVCHDYEFGRTTREKGCVGDYNLSELQKMECGEWKDQRFKGTLIPSLEQVLEVIPKDFFLNIEVKYQSFREGGKPHSIMFDQLIPLLDKKRDTANTLISSFDINFLAYCARKRDDLKLGFLDHECDTKGLDLNRAAEVKAYSYHPNFQKVSTKQVETLKRNGYKVFVYTVNDVNAVDQLLAWNIDGVFTDEVELLIERVGHSHKDLHSE